MRDFSPTLYYEMFSIFHIHIFHIKQEVSTWTYVILILFKFRMNYLNYSIYLNKTEKNEFKLKCIK